MLLILLTLYICPPSTERYKEKIAHIESRGDYCANNGDHYGKYQFSLATIRGLIVKGYVDAPCDGLTIDYFLCHPWYQERVMNAHIYHQTELIERMHLFRYKGKTIRGIKITVERIFAGVHFVGPASMNHFLRTGSTRNKGKMLKKDRFGTTLTGYMRMI